MQEIINKILARLISENETRITNKNMKVTQKKKNDKNGKAKPKLKSVNRKTKLLFFLLVLLYIATISFIIV